MNRDVRIGRYQKANQRLDLSEDSLRILIENAGEAAVAKGLKEVGGLPPEQWVEQLRQRVGREPFFRLVFILIRDMNSAKGKYGPIVLQDVLCEDPTLWVECSKTLSLENYFAQWPPK
jgi:hypothetical protein